MRIVFIMDRIEERGNWTTSSSNITKGALLFSVEACIFLLLDISAFVGNSLVCLAIYRNSSLRTITNVFILSLAFTDLLAAILIMPFNTAASFANRWVFGYAGCQLVGVFAYNWAGISLLTLTWVAINRYIRVVRSSIYPKIYSKKRAFLMIVTTWVLTIAVVGIIFPVTGIEFQAKPENPAIVSPYFSNRKSSIVFHSIHIAYIILPSVIMATCYAKVLVTVRQHNSSVTPSLHSGHNRHGIEEAKMTKLLAAVLVGFYLCWLPGFVTIILRMFNAVEKVHEVYSNFFYLFPAYTSSVINPVICATMSKRFRTEFVNILRLR